MTLLHIICIDRTFNASGIFLAGDRTRTVLYGSCLQ